MGHAVHDGPRLSSAVRPAALLWPQSVHHGSLQAYRQRAAAERSSLLVDRSHRVDGRRHHPGAGRPGAGLERQELSGQAQMARDVLHADNGHHPRRHSVAGAVVRKAAL